jgi:hypothetical protein
MFGLDHVSVVLHGKGALFSYGTYQIDSTGDPRCVCCGGGSFGFGFGFGRRIRQ